MLSKRPIRPMVHDNNLTALSPNALDTPERVLEYCKSLGLDADDALNIEALIKQTPELTLEKEPLGENDAYIEKIDDEKYKIVINSAHHHNRQRFSMAHEFAHYQLHRDEIENMPQGEKIMHRNDEKNPIEAQANRFASEILMPRDKFLKLLGTHKGNIAKMAEAFKISQLALRYRAKNLGISGHGV